MRIALYPSVTYLSDHSVETRIQASEVIKKSGREWRAWAHGPGGDVHTGASDKKRLDTNLVHFTDWNGKQDEN